MNTLHSYSALLDVLTAQEIQLQSLINAMNKAGIMYVFDPSHVHSEQFAQIRKKTHAMYQTYLHGYESGKLHPL